MKITVNVKPNAKKESVTLMEDGSYVVRVNAPPNEGKANKRVIELLSESLKKPKSSFLLLSGHKGKKKIIEVS